MSINFLKILSAVPLSLPFVPLVFSTSCATVKFYNIDGTNWIGYRAGYFSPNEYVIDDDNHTVTYIHSSHYAANNLIIPNTVDFLGEQYRVLLGESCFEENNFISGYVTFNENITTIPKRCFFNTHYLNELRFVVPIINVCDYAFYGCGLLSDITSDFFFFSQIETIGDYAFYGTNLDMEIVLPPTLKKLGDYAFAYCGSIRKVDLSACTNYEKVGNYQFINCDALTDISLPSSCWAIGDYAFAGCFNLETVNLAKDNINLTIGEGAFLSDKLFTGFSRPFQFYKLSRRCFEQCSSFYLTTNMLSNPNLTVIPDFAFSHSPVNIITFPPNIKHILQFAFYSSESLKVLDFSNYPIDEYPTISGTTTFSGNSGSGLVFIPRFANFNLWKQALTNKGLNFDGSWTILYPND